MDQFRATMLRTVHVEAQGLTATPETLAAHLLALMNERRITSLFVVEDGRPVGILHLHDLLRLGVA
jgi:arabinose-5-phosphate isomerase